MTRHGTLVYYLTAWVIGCFIIAALFATTGNSMTVSLLLATYFFALIGGLLDVLLFAFLLRNIMHALHARNVLAWMTIGAGIFSALVYLLASASQKRPVTWWSGTPQTISNLVLGGALALRRTGHWQAPVDGALTAAVLCLVDRAFSRAGEPSEQSPQAKHSAA